MSECRTYLFSVSLLILCAEVYLLSSVDARAPGNEPLPRGLFVAAFTLFFLLTGLFKYMLGLFADGRAPVLLSLLPAGLLLFLMTKAGVSPFLSCALAAAAAARLFFDFVPKKERLQLWGVFVLDAAALCLFLSGRALAGSFITDKILFVSLVVLTLSSLQKLTVAGKGEAFPLHYFVLLGALLMLIPMKKDPIDWSPLVNAGGQLVRRAAGLADSASYYLFSGLDDGTYTTGYSSLDMTGGKAGASQRTQLILRTGEKPYFTYTDPETSAKKRVRRLLYLAGGRPADKGQLLRFLRFLHARGVDRQHASLFSKISRISVEYAFLDTFDEIAPAGSILLCTQDGKVKIESGVSTSRHKKGYSLEAEYLDIDYGSPYLSGLFRETGAQPQTDSLSFKEAREYTMALFGIDLGDVLTRDEYNALLQEDPPNELTACLDTAGAGSRMRELAEELTVGAQSGYEKCRRIEAYLRKYTYDLNASGGHDPGSDMNSSAGMSDIADRFLFETGSGYCVHYTSSMVMLLRLAGIPARAVPGFRFVFPLEQKDLYEVPGSCSHVWPEAYLDGIGWVPFEPTASFRAAEEYTWHREAPQQAAEGSELPAHDLPGPPAPGTGADTENEEQPSGSTALQIFRISGPVVICILLLLAALIAGRRLIAVLRYKYGAPEKQLIMDVDMIRKLLRKNASDDFIDRGLLSDYVSLAPDDIRPDLHLRSVFDTYYRVIYGGSPAVSEGENELARKVLGRLRNQLRTKNPKAGS